jgi:NAD(P)-dependent dehydrogenase (short-subunit alcohol dehydrogenase family)
VPDMQGKTVLVTGGNSGIGFETAAALAESGARVLVTARNADKGRAAVGRISERAAAAGTGGGAQLVVFDLADLKSVRRGADEILEQAPRLDVVVNNAGLVLSEWTETVDGLEATLATNHLGPFLLTNLLLDRVTASAPARIVNVSSTAHGAARKGIPFDDLQSQRRYRTMRVYGQSKLANILFTQELARRLDGTGVTANSLHPGTVRTGYGADGDAKGFLAFGIKISAPFFLSPAQGARTSIYLASSPEVDGVSGKYFVKCKEKEPKRQARDPEAAQRLWQVSEELVGLTPAPPHGS